MNSLNRNSLPHVPFTILLNQTYKKYAHIDVMYDSNKYEDYSLNEKRDYVSTVLHEFINEDLLEDTVLRSMKKIALLDAENKTNTYRYSYPDGHSQSVHKWVNQVDEYKIADLLIILVPNPSNEIPCSNHTPILYLNSDGEKKLSYKK